MAKKTVDDVLKEGIYGPKETKPDERRKYLGTLRERVVIALTTGETMGSDTVQPELKRLLDENKEAHLFLNGNVPYTALSKYIKAAMDLKMDYTIVTNKEHQSEFGLVLAHSYAINKEQIRLDKKPAGALKQSAPKQTLLSKVKSIFVKK